MQAPALNTLRPARRLGLLAATLLLHWGLLAIFLGSGPAPAPQRPSRTMDVVWVAPRPVAPPPLPVLLPPPVQAAPMRTRPARVRPQRMATTVAAAPQDDRPAMTSTAQPAPAPSGSQESQPVFDRSAALATARAMANDKDPARAGLAVAQFDKKGLGPTESEQLGKVIASGHRKACIGPEAAPGNLLTPLMWLPDKKDHGCKF